MALDLAMILGIGFGNDNKSTGKKEKLDKFNFIKIKCISLQKFFIFIKKVTK